MDAPCKPAITTAAAFVALLFLDLFRRDFELLPEHTFFGILSVLGMTILCQHNVELAAWGLLVTPFVILFIGWLLYSFTLKSEISQPAVPQRKCRECRGNPCMCRRPT